MNSVSSTPSVVAQAERLIESGVAVEAGVSARDLRVFADRHRGVEQALLVIRPDLMPSSRLVSRLRLGDKSGFVVVDMPDIDDFGPAHVTVPDAPFYLLMNVDRGDEFANRSPEEVLPELEGAGRSPFMLGEGIHWVIQHPAILRRNHCFMTIGSRLKRPDGTIDARTPALWISNGTGRDGVERRGAPKVGWCWWRNRHTWLGFASTTARVG